MTNPSTSRVGKLLDGLGLPHLATSFVECKFIFGVVCSHLSTVCRSQWACERASSRRVHRPVTWPHFVASFMQVAQSSRHNPGQDRNLEGR